MNSEAGTGLANSAAVATADADDDARCSPHQLTTD